MSSLAAARLRFSPLTAEEVQRQWTHGAYAPTKSGRLRRVDMARQLCEELKRVYESRQVELAVEGKEHDPEKLVFRNSAGGPLDKDNVRRRIPRPCLHLGRGTVKRIAWKCLSSLSRKVVGRVGLEPTTR
jgi:integrase